MAKLKLNLIVILSAVCGCASSTSSPPPDPIAEAGEGVAGIVAHTESAERHVQRAIPHADTTGKVYLTAASEEHTEVLSDVAETKTALVAAKTQVNTLNTTIADREASYRKLEGRWFVAWGRRLERLFWIVTLSWLTLGVASVVFGLGNPLSWTWRIGKEITRLLPMMNCFSWVRDWLLRRRAAHG